MVRALAHEIVALAIESLIMRISNGPTAGATFILRATPLTILAGTCVAILLDRRLRLKLLATQGAGAKFTGDTSLLVLHSSFRTKASLIAGALRGWYGQLRVTGGFHIGTAGLVDASKTAADG